MAGIGFELSKILERETYSGLLRAYTYAGILSSGAWLFSIIVIMFIIWFVQWVADSRMAAMQFAVSVTYLIAGSLIISGLFQHSFTRFVADRLYEKKPELILPNLLSVILVLALIAGVFGVIFCQVLLGDEPFFLKLAMWASFVVLSIIWVCSNLLSGLQKYKAIVACFIFAYLIIAAVAIWLLPYGLTGLIAAFYLGQSILLLCFLFFIAKEYPPHELIRWDFFTKDHLQWTLVSSCVLLNAGVWVDKFLFWANPLTGIPVLGHLNMSQLYDFPMFLALLTLTPGLAMFLMRVETLFSINMHLYLDSILQGATLIELRKLSGSLVQSARKGIYDVVSLQTIIVFCVILYASNLMSWLKLTPFYVNLLKLDTVAAGLLVLLLCLFNMLFYFDKLKQALLLSIFFVTTNAIFTSITLAWGVYYYGYGFAVSLGLSSLLALYLLQENFENFEYDTFMRPGK